MSSRNEIPSDTSPAAEQVQIDAWRRMTPEQKVAQVFALNRLVHEVAAAGVRDEYPDASEREVFLRVMVRKLGPELVARVYGFDAERGA